jgi:Dolichyl-phosphate-mannose-protein mannosyltransferase
MAEHVRPHSSNRTILIASLFVVIVALLPRIPLVSAGLPFLYREDDTHHTNRVLEMYKANTLDPQYFHKPSLHFYLRLPVVHASALWLQSQGALESRREIRTRDPYGLAGYNFTASHPLLVKTSRALSVAWSLGTVLFVMLIAFRLKLSAGMAILAGAVTAFSPEFLINSPIVGVDILMALFCTATALVGVFAIPSPTRLHFILTGALGGLAASSKYNALPICAVPIVLWLIAGWRTRFYDLFLSGAAFILAFFIASPFILVSWATFTSQLGYEVWHYQTGHDGHSAEPGIPQAAFYLSWLMQDGIGVAASALAVLGLAASKRWGRSSLVYLIFPLLFAGLMISQRTNFTRNMVPVIPFAALLCAMGGEWLRSYVRTPITRSLFDAGLIVAVLAQPVLRSAEIVATEQYPPESRIELEKWIRSERPSDDDLAIAGPLLMPIGLFALPGVDAFDPKKDTIESLVQKGFSYIALPAWLSPQSTAFSLVDTARHYHGGPDKPRIVKNPALTVWKVRDDPDWNWSSPLTTTLPLSSERTVCRSSQEGHCWVQGRFTRLRVPKQFVDGRNRFIEVMSPWDEQMLTLTGETRATVNVSLEVPGAWKQIALPDDHSEVFMVTLSDVHSLASRGTGADSRRIGVAVREAQTTGQLGVAGGNASINVDKPDQARPDLSDGSENAHHDGSKGPTLSLYSKR